MSLDFGAGDNRCLQQKVFGVPLVDWFSAANDERLARTSKEVRRSDNELAGTAPTTVSITILDIHRTVLHITGQQRAVLT